MDSDLYENGLKPTTIYELRDRLITLKKMGCGPRFVNALGIEFDTDLTLVELLGEFETVDGIVIPSDIDGIQVRGLRRLSSLKSVGLLCCAEPRRSEIRLPREIRDIQLYSRCPMGALDLSRILSRVIPPRPVGTITLTLDAPKLIHDWGGLKIPSSISTIVTSRRRNHPGDFLAVLESQGFRRKSRTEDGCTFERVYPPSS